MLRSVRGLPRPAATRPRWFRALVAVACPLLATILASVPDETPPTVAAMLYLLGVLAAAVFAGLAGGLVASLLSFLGLNVFFTPPVGTFRVQKTEDFVALLAFLGVSALVATLLTRARSEQVRAEKREQETWHLYQVASRLLAGEGIDVLLNQMASNLVELFDLARCEVRATGPDATRMSASAGDGPDEADAITIPLRTERGDVGILLMVPRTGGHFDGFEQNLAETFAAQMALVIESSRLDSARRDAVAEAETNRIRAALFSSVTHDLKTPLASIKASATSLLDDQVTFALREREELLRTIVEETDRLNRLIGNLLDLSRMRAGALTPRKVSTPIEEVIEGVVGRLRPILTGRDLQIRVRDGMPPVAIDAMQIDQALTNLLENALKYTDRQSPIGIAAQDWHSFVEVLVSDHGPGIPVEDRAKVFDEFHRRDVNGREGGTGLGLAIARAMVLAHGGDMWVQETPGGGATVGFRLPIGRGRT